MLKRLGLLGMVLVGCSLMAAEQRVGAQRTVTVQPMAAEPAIAPASTMTFDAVVTDKAGQPLTGLKAGNFTVLDDGKPVPIQSFAAYDTAGPAGPESVIVVIDDVNTDAADLIYARNQIGKFLTMNGGELPAPVSLLLLTDRRLRQIAAPSQDGKQLNSELQKVPGLIRQMPQGGIYHAEDRMNISLRGLILLAAAESKVPGRKLVIWVSPGWWMFDNPRVILWDRQEKAVYRLIVGASQALRQARITLDAVDPLGTKDANALHTYLWESYMKPVTSWERAQTADLALQVLAAQSGGRVLWGGNDVAEELEACASDAKAWYALSIAVPAATEPDSWQGVEMKVDAPGARVRTQNGYYAAPAK